MIAQPQECGIIALVAMLFKKSPVRLTPTQFKKWLVGFIDAEGNFKSKFI